MVSQSLWYKLEDMRLSGQLLLENAFGLGGTKILLDQNNIRGFKFATYLCRCRRDVFVSLKLDLNKRLLQ